MGQENHVQAARVVQVARGSGGEDEFGNLAGDDRNVLEDLLALELEVEGDERTTLADQDVGLSIAVNIGDDRRAAHLEGAVGVVARGVEDRTAVRPAREGLAVGLDYMNNAGLIDVDEVR